MTQDGAEASLPLCSGSGSGWRILDGGQIGLLRLLRIGRQVAPAFAALLGGGLRLINVTAGKQQQGKGEKRTHGRQCGQAGRFGKWIAAAGPPWPDCLPR